MMVVNSKPSPHRFLAILFIVVMYLPDLTHGAKAKPFKTDGIDLYILACAATRSVCPDEQFAKYYHGFAKAQDEFATRRALRVVKKDMALRRKRLHKKRNFTARIYFSINPLGSYDFDRKGFNLRGTDGFYLGVASTARFARSTFFEGGLIYSAGEHVPARIRVAPQNRHREYRYVQISGLSFVKVDEVSAERIRKLLKMRGMKDAVQVGADIRYSFGDTYQSKGYMRGPTARIELQQMQLSLFRILPRKTKGTPFFPRVLRIGKVDIKK